MRCLVQRVSRARVTVEGTVTGEIGAGLLVLIGVARGDTPEQARYLAEKVRKLRVFDDEDGRMNLALNAVLGSAVLTVSQFTLYADCRKGNRPSYVESAPPEEAEELYEAWMEAARQSGMRVESGVFGAHMDVELVNDGPVTILLESRGDAG